MFFSNKRIRQTFPVFSFLVLLTMASSSLSAQSPPSINSLSVPSSVKEMGIRLASVSASDPDGDPITYTWSFESDATGQAHFFDTPTASYSKTLSGSNKKNVIFGVGNPLTLPEGPSAMQGQQFTVRVEVSDGSNTVAKTALVTVSGFNQKPIITLDTRGMGTRAEPKVSPGAVSLTASQSYDPDGSPIRFAWKLAGVSGGYVCPGGILVVFGKETDKPSLPIPNVSAKPNSPMKFTFSYRVIDQMYTLKGTAAGYGASPSGCEDSGGDDGGGEDNPPPQVSINASATQAIGGDVVIMTGVIDDPADTHTQSWMQLDNTTPVALSSATDSSTAFVAPNANALLKFRFTATDSADQSASADIAILVSPNPNGGGGGSGDGGSGDGGSGDGGSGDGGGGDEGTGSGGSAGSNSGCSGLNLPAVATVPAAYTITEALHGQIHASDASDPDNTPGNPINGQAASPGVTFLWSITSGLSLMSDQSLEGRTTATVGFTAPQVETDTTFGLELYAQDARGCGTRYPIELIVQDEVVNNDPTLVLHYQVQGQDISGQVPAGNITVDSPATILLDASESSDPDDDPITISWEKSTETLTSGSTVLSAE